MFLAPLVLVLPKTIKLVSNKYHFIEIKHNASSVWIFLDFGVLE